MTPKGTVCRVRDLGASAASGGQGRVISTAAVDQEGNTPESRFGTEHRALESGFCQETVEFHPRRC